MNFIIEVLPKQENANDFVIVVRAHNGFPLSVCDSLEDATKLISSKIDAAIKDKKIVDNA